MKNKKNENKKEEKNFLMNYLVQMFLIMKYQLMK